MTKIAKWLPALLLLMPRWLASLSTALLVSASVMFFVWLHSQPTYVIGTIDSVAKLNHGQQVMVAVADPLDRILGMTDKTKPKLVVTDWRPGMGLDPDKTLWCFAMGKTLSHDGEFTILHAEDLAVVVKPWSLTIAGTSFTATVYPLVAIGIGSLFLVAGPLFTRLLSSLVLGAMLSITVWHGLHLADYFGAIRIADPMATLIACLVFLVGAVIGFRARRDQLNVAVERIILVLIIAASLPTIGERFGVTNEAFLYGTILLSLVTSVIGYALLGGYWLSIGMRASVGASYVILLSALLIVIVLRSAFPGEHDPIMRRLNAYIDRNSGRISLSRILNLEERNHV